MEHARNDKCLTREDLAERIRKSERYKYPDCRKRCVHPLAPSARGLRPQAVGERTVRLPEIFRVMARFSPSAPTGHLPHRGRFFDTLKYQRASPSFKIECDALIMLFGGRSWLYKGFSLAPIIHYWHPNLVCQSPDLRKFSFFNIAGRLYLPF